MSGPKINVAFDPNANNPPMYNIGSYIGTSWGQSLLANQYKQQQQYDASVGIGGAPLGGRTASSSGSQGYGQAASNDYESLAYRYGPGSAQAQAALRASSATTHAEPSTGYTYTGPDEQADSGAFNWWQDENGDWQSAEPGVEAAQGTEYYSGHLPRPPTGDEQTQALYDNLNLSGAGAGGGAGAGAEATTGAGALSLADARAALAANNVPNAATLTPQQTMYVYQQLAARGTVPPAQGFGDLLPAGTQNTIVAAMGGAASAGAANGALGTNLDVMKEALILDGFGREQIDAMTPAQVEALYSRGRAGHNQATRTADLQQQLQTRAEQARLENEALARREAATNAAAYSRQAAHDAALAAQSGNTIEAARKQAEADAAATMARQAAHDAATAGVAAQTNQARMAELQAQLQAQTGQGAQTNQARLEETRTSGLLQLATTLMAHSTGIGGPRNMSLAMGILNSLGLGGLTGGAGTTAGGGASTGAPQLPNIQWWDWDRMSPSAKTLILDAYASAGGDPNDVEAAIDANRPQRRASTSYQFAPLAA